MTGMDDPQALRAAFLAAFDQAMASARQWFTDEQPAVLELADTVASRRLEELLDAPGQRAVILDLAVLGLGVLIERATAFLDPAPQDEV